MVDEKSVEKPEEKTVGVSFLDALDRLESEGGGGDIVGYVNLLVGWKVFIKGMKNEETFFQFNPADASDNEKKAALQKAKNLLVEKGITDKKPIPQVIFVVNKDSVLVGAKSKWDNDRWFSVTTFSAGYKKYTKPSLKTNLTEIKALSAWMKIGFENDPDGRTRDWEHEDELGNRVVTKVIDKVPYLAEIYVDESHARKANDLEPSEPLEVPTGWDAETWQHEHDDIINRVVTEYSDLIAGGKTSHKLACIKLGKDYLLPVEFVEKLVS